MKRANKSCKDLKPYTGHTNVQAKKTLLTRDFNNLWQFKRNNLNNNHTKMNPPPYRPLIIVNITICFVAFVKTENRTAGRE